MENFEQIIINAVNEKLNDGTVEKLVQQYVEKGVSDAISSLFSSWGDAEKSIRKKLSEVIVPAIEHHDFNQYLTKLDAVLAEIVNSTSLADNKEILENFKSLMREPEIKEIKLSEIFEQYCKHVAENVKTYGLEAYCDDGEPYYEHVTARMEVVYEEKWSTSNYDDCIVRFVCDEDEGLNCQIKLYKMRTTKDKWTILSHGDSIDISSLRGLSNFEIFLMTLRRAFVKIVMDEEYDRDDDIEPEEKPEWTLS